jgi:hypothetical protein
MMLEVPQQINNGINQKRSLLFMAIFVINENHNSVLACSMFF